MAQSLFLRIIGWPSPNIIINIAGPSALYPLRAQAWRINDNGLALGSIRSISQPINQQSLAQCNTYQAEPAQMTRSSSRSNLAIQTRHAEMMGLV